ncbi:rod shape-determining protein RodA [Vineibacter terrae]|uniref:Peptidoglycan glycosyltransferase MrdB n=1 Tax=Vineibacter terrae TaxID=2586908 RepID=A0A5C8PRB6_9HYPH|nr:rod shape-determining protein RodA [Vineibacter terrae]TXL77545.1 rod shape-determining protein RodA [Vineibacter terrae]HEX2889048.1 rod shape-determining protein RodA [Vineibacter terrae]
MSLAANRSELTLPEKIRRLDWRLVLVLIGVAGVGTAALYSAGGMKPEPWAIKHATRFAIGAAVMLMVALVDLRVWMRLAYPAYVVSVLLLVAVDVIGKGAMGAQRWLDIGPVQIQPSELMKIAAILALSRYFHSLSREQVGRIVYVVPPVLAILVPVALVMVQPDLGTAMVLLSTGAAMMFVAGVKLWKFLLAGTLGAASLPVAWKLMHEYQRNRVRIFLDPDLDPLGAGYHILQSKIAIGSGGMLGKGFGMGTQSTLNFLPEKQTDFIFTMWTEETGLRGALILLALYVAIIIYAYIVAVRTRSHFGRLLAMGIGITVFLYVFINMGMVMGLLPVVGVPLPLVSYGGTAMLTVLFACGLLLGINVHRDLVIPRP